MKQEYINARGNNVKKTKFWKLFLWIMPALFLIFLAGFVFIRIYLVSLNASSEVLQLIDISMLLLFIMVILFFLFVMFHYLEIRYFYIPVWRWIVSGFKGKPELPFPRFPWATKAEMTKAKSKMNKKQRACMWLGNVCMLVGIIPITIGVLWFLVLDITGEHTVGSTSLILFWVGIFMFFTGVCIVRISIPKCTQHVDIPKNKPDE